MHFLEGAWFVVIITIYFYVDSWENPVMLDAPVSGGVLAAEAGTLTFMVWFRLLSIQWTIQLPMTELSVAFSAQAH